MVRVFNYYRIIEYRIIIEYIIEYNNRNYSFKEDILNIYVS